MFLHGHIAHMQFNNTSENYSMIILVLYAICKLYTLMIHLTLPIKFCGLNTGSSLLRLRVIKQPQSHARPSHARLYKIPAQSSICSLGCMGKGCLAVNMVGGAAGA